MDRKKLYQSIQKKTTSTEKHFSYGKSSKKFELQSFPLSVKLILITYNRLKIQSKIHIEIQSCANEQFESHQEIKYEATRMEHDSTTMKCASIKFHNYRQVETKSAKKIRRKSVCVQKNVEFVIVSKKKHRKCQHFLNYLAWVQKPLNKHAFGGNLVRFVFVAKIVTFFVYLSNNSCVSMLMCGDDSPDEDFSGGLRSLKMFIICMRGSRISLDSAV